jgi:hypothetical protein
MIIGVKEARELDRKGAFLSLVHQCKLSQLLDQSVPYKNSWIDRFSYKPYTT